jgi:hypothetical protein
MRAAATADAVLQAERCVCEHSLDENQSQPLSMPSCNFLEVQAMPAGTKPIEMDLTPMVQIDVLEKPIERIKETCALMGIAEKLDRALPDLETFLEGEVARGETRETRLTFDGLLYLKQRLAVE